MCYITYTPSQTTKSHLLASLNAHIGTNLTFYLLMQRNTSVWESTQQYRTPTTLRDWELKRIVLEKKTAHSGTRRHLRDDNTDKGPSSRAKLHTITKSYPTAEITWILSSKQPATLPSTRCQWHPSWTFSLARHEHFRTFRMPQTKKKKLCNVTLQAH